MIYCKQFREIKGGRMALGLILGIILTAAFAAIYLWITDRSKKWNLPDETPPSPLKKFGEWWKGLKKSEKQIWIGMVATIAILVWILGFISSGFCLAMWIIWPFFLGVGLYQLYKRTGPRA